MKLQPLRAIAPRWWSNASLRHLAMWAGVLTVITVSGSVGYMLIEHWNWFDALYMTVITISTTGFKEVHPMSRWGEAFTMMLSLSGVFLIFGTVGLVAEAVMTDARSG
ncbi:MAG TPA: hypothetical protein DEG88_12385, partial [Propionibacteriaceae bacterium]|nr:hypothetical protein [Propionibacteriaceae bacterium]HBY24031.1 hypothetical protein [Propionibacteriaceae bacterium]